MELNPHQRRAVQAVGPVAIIAGPGTGKTKTLVARIEHLVASGVEPTSILALTFTKKSAQEMMARLSVNGVVVSTFHALCHSLLGGVSQFISEPERLAVIKQLTKPASFKSLTTRDIGLLISRAKNGAEDSGEITALVAEYDAALALRNMIDFDDLLLRTIALLQAQPAKRPRFAHILVDEFQDTNAVQYTLLQLLRSNDNVFVIGDPNQSIYGFRGASGTIFDTFAADFPNCTQITLNTNYRSAPQIVALSNAIFGGTQHAARSGAGQVSAVEVLNEYSEARFVLDQIQAGIGGADLLKASAGEHRHSLRDFAILYRNRSAARAMQKSVDDSGLPYQVVGEGSPYEQPAVQKIIAVLRAKAGDVQPTGSLSAPQIEHIVGVIDSDSPADIARRAAEVMGIEITPTIEHFIGTLVRFASAQQAVEYIDAIAGQQFYDPQAEAITLLTIHASKGLEFPQVFLIGAQEGILPHTGSDVGEEKRLFYVAATRAQDQLTIPHARNRGGKSARASRFITEIPASILPRIIDPALAQDQKRLQKRATKRAQTSLF